MQFIEFFEPRKRGSNNMYPVYEGTRLYKYLDILWVITKLRFTRNCFKNAIKYIT